MRSVATGIEESSPYKMTSVFSFPIVLSFVATIQFRHFLGKLEGSRLPSLLGKSCMSRKPNRLLVFLGVCFAWLESLSIAQVKPGPTLDERLSQEFNLRVRPLLKKYCFECHSEDGAEAGVDISMYRNLDKIRESESQWEQIRGLIRIGAMPPPEHATQPTDAERQTMSEWIRRGLTEIDCNAPNPPAPITVRRLNRIEYDNTIRDLFGLDLTPSNVIGFVSDDVGNGFDNQGEVLSLSPLILEKYSQAAEWISQKVISTKPDALRVQSSTSDPIPVGANFQTEFLFADGEYKLEARMRVGSRSSGKASIEIYFDDEKLGEVSVDQKSSSFSKKLDVKSGRHMLRVEIPDTEENQSFRFSRDATLYVEQLSATGPTKGAPPLPTAHQSLMVAVPSEKVTVEEAADKIVREMLPRAYRRPITREERERIVAIIVKASKNGWSFPESVQFGLQAVLVSPEFLYRIEKPFDSFDLASRLSYFLWASMPDEELFRAAAKGQLGQPEQLKKQVERMLADPKSDALVHGFFDQWLGLRNLASVSVDDREFPVWSSLLSDALAKETFLFCREMLHHGSLNDLLTADFTFVNPRLADFYQVKYGDRDPKEMYVGSTKSYEFEQRNGRYFDEDKWIRVSLPEQRRGLLTQASILTLTSNPTRTSPVKRGKWVLDNILGDPPPPAPPGVPSLEESVGENQKLSLRKQLEQHRANPSCASCHKVLDPIGLGLENFDAIGQWRTKDEGQTIVAEGQLADGRKFSSPKELMKLLENDKPKIARHFAAQLLTYSLGRGLTRGDGCTVDSIVRQASASDLNIKSFIMSVVTSKPFLHNGEP